MGLVKRGTLWWMSFMFNGQQVRRSTGTSDRRLAEAILGKVKVQIGNLSLYRVRTDAGRIIEVSAQNRRRQARRYLEWDDRVHLSWDVGSALLLTE